MPRTPPPDPAPICAAPPDRWRLQGGLPFSAFIVADGLHMNDWSYACMARLLADALVAASTSAALAAYR